MAKRKPSVAIVDDNDMTRALLRGILRQNNYEVAGEAKDGEGALNLLDRIQPDVVCLDVNMPKSGGLEVLPQIREKWPKVAVLMITAATDRETVQSAIEGGACGYVVKPFNAAKVLDTLGRVVK